MSVDKSVVAVFFIGLALIISLVFSFYAPNETFKYVVIGALTALLALIDPKSVVENVGKNA